MNILILSNLYPPDVIGGYELGCQSIAEALVRRGHSISVATSEARKPLQHSAESISTQDHMIRVHRIFRPQWEYEERILIDSHATYKVTARQRQVLCDITSALALYRLIKAEKPDVIYVFNIIGLGPF